MSSSNALQSSSRMVSGKIFVPQKCRLCDLRFSKSLKFAELGYPQELLNSIETGASLSYHEIALKKEFIVVLLRNLKSFSGHVIGIRYVVENMNPYLLFLKSVSGSKTGARLILPRMNCTFGKNDFPIPQLRRC